MQGCEDRLPIRAPSNPGRQPCATSIPRDRLAQQSSSSTADRSYRAVHRDARRNVVSDVSNERSGSAQFVMLTERPRCFTLRTVTSPATGLVARQLLSNSAKQCDSSSVCEQHLLRLTTPSFGDLHAVGCPIGHAIAAAGVIERLGCVASSQRRDHEAQLTPRLFVRAVRRRSPRRWRR